MALRICSIASGSKGNCIFVGSNSTSLLVDFGVSWRRVSSALSALGVGTAQDIFLTHAHSDHFRYIPDALKCGATLHYNCGLRSSIAGKVAGERKEFNGDVHIGDITVSAFPVLHDVPCFGYSFYSEGSKVTVVTDLGVMPKSTLKAISDSDAVLIESNYDPDMIRANCYYPEYLKARIASSRGHLSNQASAECVAYLVGKGVKYIMLGHLSEQNNTPDIALTAAHKALKEYNLAGSAEIKVAAQNEMSEVIEV